MAGDDPTGGVFDWMAGMDEEAAARAAVEFPRRNSTDAEHPPPVDVVDEGPPVAVEVVDALVVPERDAHADDVAIDAAVANVISPATKAIYLRQIRAFLRELDALTGKGPAAATGDDLLLWWRTIYERTNAKGQRLGPATINGSVAAVARFYREGVRRKIFTENPTELIPYLRVNKQPKGRALTPAEATLLIAACPATGTLLDLRNRLAISMLLFTGGRVAEICAVNVDDVQSDRGHAVIRFFRKGGVEDRQKLTADLAVLIDSWRLRSEVSTGPLVRAVTRDAEGLEVVRPGRISKRRLHDIVKAKGAAAGLGSDVGPHDLRRTWISAAVAMGVDVTKISRGAGHADLETTMRYVHHHDMLDNHPSDAVAAWLQGEKPKTEGNDP